MRVGLIIYGDLHTATGGYVYDRRLVEHLRACGDSVEVFSLPPRRYLLSLADNLSPDLARQVCGARLDVLLEDELNHPSLVAQGRRLRRGVGKRIAIVHHLRASESAGPAARALARALERRYLVGVDGCIFNSQATRSSVEALVGAGRPQVVAAPGGDRLRARLTPALIEARARAPGPLRLLFLGAVVPRKGLHVLLRALRDLPPGTWSLAVAGDPDRAPAYAAALRRQVQADGLAGRVRFLGRLPDAALADWMRHSHVLSVPSLYEGFGIAYLEAMRFGLPCLAGAAGGAPEVVLDGQTGACLPPGQPAPLARWVACLAGDRALLARMSLAAFRHARSQPGWAETGQAVRAFLLEQTPSERVRPAALREPHLTSA